MNNPFIAQLVAVVNEHATAISASRFSDASDVLSETDRVDLQTRCLAVIQRSAGESSVYFKQAQAAATAPASSHGRLSQQIGVAKSLLSDTKNGFLKSLEEIIHADLFADFLEMSEHLNASGYKDAAAVVAGSTLEAHLKQLCNKFGVPTDDAGKPKKADLINSDLVKASAYTKLDQKNVTAWLGLRNDAAHGNYVAYDASQVDLLIKGVRDFIIRNPA